MSYRWSHVQGGHYMMRPILVIPLHPRNPKGGAVASPTAHCRDYSHGGVRAGPAFCVHTVPRLSNRPPLQEPLGPDMHQPQRNEDLNTRHLTVHIKGLILLRPDHLHRSQTLGLLASLVSFRLLLMKWLLSWIE